MDLSMDVVFEVSFTHLVLDAPNANLPDCHVSQLSKQFRSMFSSRSALFVWQTVFLIVDLWRGTSSHRYFVTNNFEAGKIFDWVKTEGAKKFELPQIGQLPIWVLLSSIKGNFASKF